jgi:hypothetical protein
MGRPPAREVAQIRAAIGREFSHSLLAAAAIKPEAELAAALDRLMQSGLLSRQGLPPHANYLFKHALIQDAAYGTLLREPRRALHARIANALESIFPEIALRQPELLARHYTEAGLIERAAIRWGKAGQRSLERSAPAEAAEQLTRALAQIASLPPTAALRREQISLQVTLIFPLMYLKGYAAPETKAALERSRLLIEQANTLGEPPEDPLMPFSILSGLWVGNLGSFDGDALREIADEFLGLAQKQRATAPLMNGHRLAGSSLFFTGDPAGARVHLDRAIALYDPTAPRQLTTRFGTDIRNVVFCHRSWALWVLGYPMAALADAEFAVKDGLEFGQAATLIQTLVLASYCHIFSGNYAVAMKQIDESVTLAGEKTAAFWKSAGTLVRAWALFAHQQSLRRR